MNCVCVTHLYMCQPWLVSFVVPSSHNCYLSHTERHLGPVMQLAMFWYDKSKNDVFTATRNTTLFSKSAEFSIYPPCNNGLFLQWDASQTSHSFCNRCFDITNKLSHESLPYFNKKKIHINNIITFKIIIKLWNICHYAQSVGYFTLNHIFSIQQRRNAQFLFSYTEGLRKMNK